MISTTFGYSIKRNLASKNWGKIGHNLAELHSKTLGINKNLLRSKECLLKIRLPLTYKNVSSEEIIQDKIDLISNDLINNRICLVHTDYKPNNIFIDNNGAIIPIDFEFAHIGDPAAECGFFIGIYIHYAFSNPDRIKPYLSHIQKLWEVYRERFTLARRKDFEQRVIQHIGVQILVRLDGRIKFSTSQKTEIQKKFRQIAKKMIFEEIKNIEDIEKSLCS